MFLWFGKKETLGFTWSGSAGRRAMKRPIFAIPAAAFVLASSCAPAGGPYQTTGIKIGEVDQHSAIVWARTTQNRNRIDPTRIEDAAPGVEGEVRLSYWRLDTPDRAETLDWTPVDPDEDFTHQFELTGLSPATRYGIEVEARPMGGDEPTSTVVGGFRTAPSPDDDSPVQFVVVTCQSVRSIDSGQRGHFTYKVMKDLEPDFFVHTGDIVYYDREPLSTNAKLARDKWARMFSYGYNRDFHRSVTSYFMKDDHDTVKNDCWAGQAYHDLTWDDGLDIFLEQVPMGEKTYRTYRWGKDLQIWMTENRDYRSANSDPDGPEKTIFGQEQKDWLQRTVQASDATFKILISPGCVVGPDKVGKSDNHANPNFKYEGEWLRRFLVDHNMFVINGDRHWQYYTIDPVSGVHEFGCGPINDLHLYGGDCGYQPKYHKFFAAKGGFLAVKTQSNDQKQPEVVLQYWGTDDDNPESGQWKVRFETTLTPDDLK
jgi:alkaline phosphatase D